MKRIIMDGNSSFTRTAVVEDDRLIELIVDDENKESLVGRIYAGKVKDILPSQFAFVDIGLERTGFLHFGDKREIGLVVKRGQQLLLQVIKDGSSEKGPVLSTMLSLTGKSLVLFRLDKSAKGAVLGVSKKIDDESRRDRLRKMARDVPDGYGVIMRTASCDRSDNEIKEEILLLADTLSQIEDKGRYTKAPALIYGGGSSLRHTLKEVLTDDVDEIIAANPQDYEEAKAEAGAARVTLYEGSIPLFRQYGLEAQIEKALQRKVWLHLGGFITIEQTEACVVIDVNTGKFGGYKDHEESVLKINREAAVEIAKQLRLRNLSGIVIIDFIKMKSQDKKEELFDLLAREVKKDRLSVTLTGMTRLGLMELTRKKTREPLASVMHYLSETSQIH